uniref:Secreted protein n=1 Tax=Panagrellus redivivus TaxID=6233 RepID=A0A7E4VQS1_PANRE
MKYSILTISIAIAVSHFFCGIKWQALCDPSSLSQPPSPLNVHQSFKPPSTNSTPESGTASSQLMLILSSLIIGVVCIHH